MSQFETEADGFGHRSFFSGYGSRFGAGYQSGSRSGQREQRQEPADSTAWAEDEQKLKAHQEQHATEPMTTVHGQFSSVISFNSAVMSGGGQFGGTSMLTAEINKGLKLRRQQLVVSKEVVEGLAKNTLTAAMDQEKPFNPKAVMRSLMRDFHPDSNLERMEDDPDRAEQLASQAGELFRLHKGGYLVLDGMLEQSMFFDQNNVGKAVMLPRAILKLRDTPA